MEETQKAMPHQLFYMYDPVADSWDVISHFSTPRIKCFAAVLPDNKIMVVGGRTNEEVTIILGVKSGKNTDSVEIASTKIYDNSTLSTN